MSQYILLIQNDILAHNCKTICNDKRASFACSAGGDYLSAGAALWAPRVTSFNYKLDNNSKYVCLVVIIDITRRIAE